MDTYISHRFGEMERKKEEEQVQDHFYIHMYSPYTDTEQTETSSVLSERKVIPVHSIPHKHACREPGLAANSHITISPRSPPATVALISSAGEMRRLHHLASLSKPAPGLTTLLVPWKVQQVDI